MLKFPFMNHWESTIAVLEDNIFSSDTTRWKSGISNLAEEDLPPESVLPKAVIERRREPRYAISLPVYHRSKGRGTGWKQTSSIDVSENGIRLAVDAPVESGTRMELSIKLPGTKKYVKLEGVVVWHRTSQNSPNRYECGVAFENLWQCSRKEKIINFMADKFCGLALRDTLGLNCRPALTKEDLVKAYRLVYQEYAARGYCEINPAQMHYHFYSILPESRTFILEIGSQVVGTVSLIKDSPMGLPSDGIYGDKIQKYRKPGRTLTEVSLLALDTRVFGKKSFVLTNFKKLSASFRLFKILFDYVCHVAGATDIFISMNPRHKDLYQYLTFDQVGPERQYMNENSPAVLMRMDIPHSVATTPVHLAIHRYFLVERISMEMLEAHPAMDTEMAWQFLVGYRDIWYDLKPAQKEYLKEIFPGIVKRGY